MKTKAILNIELEFHFEGRYSPAVTNAPYEYCHPAEYPDCIIDDLFINSFAVDVWGLDQNIYDDMVDYIFDKKDLDSNGCMDYSNPIEVEYDLCGNVYLANQDITEALDINDLIEIYWEV